MLDEAIVCEICKLSLPHTRTTGKLETSRVNKIPNYTAGSKLTTHIIPCRPFCKTNSVDTL